MPDFLPSDRDAAALRQAKQLLRHAVMLSRETRSPDAKTVDDHARFERLRDGVLHPAPRLTTVAAYLSTAFEPGTLELVGWLASQEVRVLLPALTDAAEAAHATEPDWAPYAGPDQLRMGPFSILEPTTARLGAPALREADVVVCAGLAANDRGDRLGRGGGWYDRALAAVAPDVAVWVLLNDDEVLDTIPVQDWDRTVDGIVTPTRLISTLPDGAPAG